MMDIAIESLSNMNRNVCVSYLFQESFFELISMCNPQKLWKLQYEYNGDFAFVDDKYINKKTLQIYSVSLLYEKLESEVTHNRQVSRSLFAEQLLHAEDKVTMIKDPCC